MIGAVPRSGLTAALLMAAVAPNLSAQSAPIVEIRVHGNHTTPTADVLALSGLEVGSPADEHTLGEAEDALLDSGRFDGVQVRRRFRSLDDPSDILVVIMVNETAAASAGGPVPGLGARILGAVQWLPIVQYREGYGLTYGARLGFADALGPRSRLAVPLTWGGDRRAALEWERGFTGGPVVRGSASVSRDVHPAFEVPDRRSGVRLGVDQPVRAWLTAGVQARLERVRFGTDYDARHTSAGFQVVVDTRADPSFPRNAVYLRAGREQLAFGDGRAGRWFTDARGYQGVWGSAVVALRALMVASDAALPRAEQLLLGGGATLRGYRTGHQVGDSLAALSFEIRQPLSSPLSVGRLGVKAFVDAGTAWASGERLARQRFDRGMGGGMYAGAAAFVLDVDVAWPERGRPRLHVGLGTSF